MAKFSEILTIKNGKNQSKVQNPNGKYPIYGSGGIMGYADNFICNPETVVIGRKGSINKPIFVDTPFWNVDTAFGLEANKELILPKYLYYFCVNFNFEKLSTTVTIPSLTKANLLEIELQLPSLNKQKQITVLLDKISELIDIRGKQLEKLDMLVKSQFIEMFGDINIDCKYPTIELGKICDSISGGTPSSKHPEYYGGNIPFVTTPVLGENYIDSTSVQTYITETGVENSATHKIPPYSLMFGNRVGVGKSSINTSMMCTNQDIISFTNIDTDRYDLLYLKKVLDQYQEYFDSQKRGATIKGVTSALVKQVQVPVAPIKIQREYVKFVKQTDKSKSAIQQSLEKLETLKKSLMQEYFG